MKFFKCNKCGEIVISTKEINISDCEQSKKELVANTSDGAKEKHVPVVSIDGNKVHVEIGSVMHPMTDAHLIEFIVIETKTGFQFKRLTSKDQPVADFICEEEVVSVYEYCNLHGLWKIDL